LRWLGDAGRDTRNEQVDNDRQQGGRDRGQGVVGTTVSWHLNELLGHPTGDINPAHRSREGEARDDRVEGLSFQFLGNKAHA